MNRFLGALGVLTVVAVSAAAVTGAFFQQQFDDVPEDHWAAEAIAWGFANGIIHGTVNNNFAPDANANRAMMITMIHRFNDNVVKASAAEAGATSQRRFSDVPADHWAHEAVSWGAENGITTGTSRTMYSPNGNSTRAQMITMLFRFNNNVVKAQSAESGTTPPASESRFSDVPEGHWAYDAVAWGVDNGITEGTGDDEFSPNAEASRAQLIVMLYRFYRNLIAGEETTTTTSTTTTTTTVPPTTFTVTPTATTNTEPPVEAVEPPVVEQPVQNVPPRVSNRFKALTVGESHSCGITLDDSVACWDAGANFERQAQPPAGRFSSISAGQAHTCGVQVDGTVKCWGRDYPPADQQLPSAAPAGTFKSVTAGWTHTCGIKTDDTVTCWSTGELSHIEVPTADQSTTFSSIAAGGGQRTSSTDHGAFNCGIKSDRTVVCWGNDDFQQTQAPSGQFSAITSGVRHTCGIKSDNTIACWGNTTTVGDGETMTTIDRGELLEAPSGTFQSIDAGWYHTCAIRTDSTVACWGQDRLGQADVPSGTYESISAGWQYTCGLRSDNTVVCWGENSYGQTSPAPAGAFSTLASGWYHTCGIHTDATVACWGRDTFLRRPPPTTLTVSLAATTVGERAGELTVTATFDWPVKSDTTVTFTASGGNATGGGVDFTTPATFTAVIPTNQTVGTATFTIEDDDIDETDETFNVAATGGGFTVEPVVVTITDDDTAGVTVSESSWTINQGDEPTYTVVLDSQPTSEVIITATSDPDTVASVAPEARTFTTSNWATAQTFTVTAVAAGTSTITHAASGTDPNYGASRNIASLEVTVVQTQ